MTDPELSIALAFALSLAVTLLATPIVAALAIRTGFYDFPVGYKGHDVKTPYLGGVALFAGIVVGVSSLGGANDRFAPLLGCAGALLALGLLDDGLPVPPLWRVGVEIAVAVVLVHFGLGWNLFPGSLADSALTAVWIVGVVNAINLMDNLDGAAGTVSAVSGAGIGVLALIGGQPGLAGLALAVTGASLGFLRYNLARPSRIFLGDSGSMTLGLLVAGMSISAAQYATTSVPSILAAGMLIGLPILDTTLVIVSRLREGVSIVTAGRDHLTHRLLMRLGSARRVALALGAAQLTLCALVAIGQLLGRGTLIAFAIACILAGLAALGILDSPGWRPLRPREQTPQPGEDGPNAALETQQQPPSSHSQQSVGVP